MIQIGKDLRRTVDFLGTREDIDSEQAGLLRAELGRLASVRC